MHVFANNEILIGLLRKETMKDIKGCGEYISDDTVLITDGPLKGMTITLSVDILEEEE